MQLKRCFNKLHPHLRRSIEADPAALKDTMPIAPLSGSKTLRAALHRVRLERGQIHIRACLAGFGLVLVMVACGEGGSSDSTSTTPVFTNSAPTGSVTVSGAAVVGSTLGALQTLADVDGLGTLQYQWSRAGVAIAGATSSTYLVLAVDVGSTVSVTVSYTDGKGSAERVSSAATAAVTVAVASAQRLRVFRS
jgi:hypothetical protein